jgi:hypothetical protein
MRFQKTVDEAYVKEVILQASASLPRDNINLAASGRILRTIPSHSTQSFLQNPAMQRRFLTTIKIDPEHWFNLNMIEQ